VRGSSRRRRSLVRAAPPEGRDRWKGVVEELLRIGSSGRAIRLSSLLQSDTLGGSRVRGVSMRERPLVRAALLESTDRWRGVVEELLRIGSSGRAIRLSSLLRSDTLGRSRVRGSSMRERPLVRAALPEGTDRWRGVVEELLQIDSSGRAICLSSLLQSDTLGRSRVRGSSRRESSLVRAALPEGTDRWRGVVEELLRIGSLG
jgi:hypothetical protein